MSIKVANTQMHASLLFEHVYIGWGHEWTLELTVLTFFSLLVSCVWDWSHLTRNALWQNIRIYNYSLPLFLLFTCKAAQLKGPRDNTVVILEARDTYKTYKHSSIFRAVGAHLQSFTEQHRARRLINGAGLSVSCPVGEIALHQAPRSSAWWQLLMELL